MTTLAEVRERHERTERISTKSVWQVPNQLASHYDRSFLLSLLDEIGPALDKLARLGNEPDFGNSIGNRIAQDALRIILHKENDDEGT